MPGRVSSSIRPPQRARSGCCCSPDPQVRSAASHAYHRLLNPPDGVDAEAAARKPEEQGGGPGIAQIRQEDFLRALKEASRICEGHSAAPNDLRPGLTTKICLRHTRRRSDVE